MEHTENQACILIIIHSSNITPRGNLNLFIHEWFINDAVSSSNNIAQYD
jgi:hypothetical protein